jgi:hypothetical protein
MAIEEGCLLLGIAEGMDLTASSAGKRIRAVRMQTVAGMRISLIAMYKK